MVVFQRICTEATIGKSMSDDSQTLKDNTPDQASNELKARTLRTKQREDERKARAAQKLRENLMRRKQQSRARRAGEADETNGLPAAKLNESS